RAPDFALDPDALAAAVGPKTRLILLNSPHNPTGRVLGPAELEAVARICVERDLLAVTDEVYEHLVYDGARHIPLATLPGMAERTVTISSHGKTFSFTGWKVGWACGPADLIAAVRTAKQYLSYSGATPFQHAATVALGLPASYYGEVAAGLAERRDLLVHGLRDAGLTTFTPQGPYFVVPDSASAGAGARLVVLTEMFPIGFSMEPERLAEPEDGPSAGFLRTQAGQLGVWLAGSVPIRPDGGGRPVNRLLLAGPGGELEHYDKLHPFTYSGEHEHYAPGSRRVTV